ncbi:hypothetical protein Nepgr_010028 [Nepenthes gracilis]|uniref:Uncharacterized protein n=1 Tax=Nepenthes gracilis TaxID=150966 RepID=A0AAD3XKN9_NEPGR|nr:hypothetical protein Nepgr_010028 [Nepenthes gracilis]
MFDCLGNSLFEKVFLYVERRRFERQFSWLTIMSNLYRDFNQRQGCTNRRLSNRNEFSKDIIGVEFQKKTLFVEQKTDRAQIWDKEESARNPSQPLMM